MLVDKVLLIDDEVEFIETLAERLRARGLEVDIATDGQQGIARAKARSYDAIILDFAMPGMNGIETLRGLLAQNPAVQVMLLTGQASIQTAAEATRLGAVDVLEKPTDVETLMTKIREARERHVALKTQQSQDQVEDILRRHGW
jgi:DNA-binding response OmpR family regulator